MNEVEKEEPAPAPEAAEAAASSQPLTTEQDPASTTSSPASSRESQLHLLASPPIPRATASEGSKTTPKEGAKAFKGADSREGVLEPTDSNDLAKLLEWLVDIWGGPEKLAKKLAVQVETALSELFDQAGAARKSKSQEDRQQVASKFKFITAVATFFARTAKGSAFVALVTASLVDALLESSSLPDELRIALAPVRQLICGFAFAREAAAYLWQKVASDAATEQQVSKRATKQKPCQPESVYAAGLLARELEETIRQDACPTSSDSDKDATLLNMLGQVQMCAKSHLKLLGWKPAANTQHARDNMPTSSRASEDAPKGAPRSPSSAAASCSGIDIKASCRSGHVLDMPTTSGGDDESCESSEELNSEEESIPEDPRPDDRLSDLEDFIDVMGECNSFGFAQTSQAALLALSGESADVCEIDGHSEGKPLRGKAVQNFMNSEIVPEWKARCRAMEEHLEELGFFPKDCEDGPNMNRSRKKQRN